MGITSSIMKEQQLAEFRKLNPTENTDLEIPTSPENRTVTDKKGFVILGILLVILIPFLIYALAKSDIRRLYHGHDSCGNLCGIANAKVEGLSCSGKDYTKEKYEVVNILTNEKKCTDECPPGYIKDDYSCYGGDPFGNSTVETVDLWTHSVSMWWKFLLTIVITTVLCTLTLLLFRYAPGVIVWGVTAISIFLALALTSFFWFAYSQWGDEDGSKQGFLALAIISTIFTVSILILFFVLFKKIKLIIQLYKETAKAMFAIPLILFLPILTIILQMIVLVCLVLTTTWMISAADLTQIENTGYYTYDRNGAMEFAMSFNAIVTIWALQFFAGCQYMVIAGSVAQWFFKKSEGIAPIGISFTNTIKFHLGTVALGAFIITLMAVVKAVIKSLTSSGKCRWVVDCICGNMEAFLKFLSKNAYVTTAIHGQSFFRSGKRAAKLLLTNAGSVIAINSVGDFVLGMTQFILLVLSTAIAYGLFSDSSYFWLPTVFAFLINIVIIMVVFGVFETTVDTLFICFCEDSTLNDGMARPYYMSTGLMQFVENSKKVYKEKK